MQVISGKYSGRKLEAVPTDKTRPTLARAKSSMFDMISDYISGSEVLDLFAGSGALGIECVSRNAKKVVFVDNQPESIKTIKRNLRKFDDDVELVLSDFDAALHNFGKQKRQFDLVLLDPPFDSDYVEKALYLLHKNNLVRDNAIVLAEMNSKKMLQNYPQKYIMIKEREYGTIAVKIFKYNKG